VYTPAHFAESRRCAVHALIRTNPFAALVTGGPDGPTATHLPFIFDSNRGAHGTLRGHMARANAQWSEPGAFDGTAEALVIFTGPHAHISPSWYHENQAVPTWNYSAVHAYGIPRTVAAPEAVLALLADQVAFFEAGFEQPWNTSALPLDWLVRLSAGVVAFEIEITRIEATSKMSQNRPTEQLLVAAELERLDDAVSVAVAAEMRASHDAR